MLTLSIHIEGKSHSDLESALNEVARLYSRGSTRGFDENDTGSFNFDIVGSEEADIRTVIDCTFNIETSPENIAKIEAELKARGVDLTTCSYNEGEELIEDVIKSLWEEAEDRGA